MDKNDYQNIISEARALIKSGGEADALDVLDSVNWRKIHNVNALIEIANLYEELGHIEDSKMLLEYAHERSPIGRMILYHLTLVCVKMDEIAEAEAHLEEFVRIAPHDSKKYILRYNIAKAKGADVKTLIQILEEMKNNDFLEEWAFELAYLYYKAGEADKCVALCDEIVIWFGDGPYVTKALELKMLYSPLDDDQAEKYEELSRKNKGITHFKQNEMLESGEVIRHDIDIATVEETPGHLNTVNLQAEIKRNIEEIMEATQEGEVSDNLENIKGLIEEIPYLQQLEDSEEIASKQKEDNKKIDESVENKFRELLDEEGDGQMSLYMPEEGEDDQVEGQITIQDVMDNWAKTQKAAEEALESIEDMKLQQAKENAIEEANQIMNKLEDAMPKLEAGVTPSELMREEVLSQAEESRAAREAEEEEAARIEAEEKAKRDAEEKARAEAEAKARAEAEARAAAEAKAREMAEAKRRAEAEEIARLEAEARAMREAARLEQEKRAAEEAAIREAKEQKLKEAEAHIYTVPKVSADGTKIDAGLEIPVLGVEGQHIIGGAKKATDKPALVHDGMPNWKPPVLSEEEINAGTVLRNKDIDEPKLEETSKVVEEAIQSQATESKIEEVVKTQLAQSRVEEAIKQAEEPAVVREPEAIEEPKPIEEPEPVIEEEPIITPVTMEEELEEPEVELEPEVKHPEVTRMPANWETSKTKVLPTVAPVPVVEEPDDEPDEPEDIFESDDDVYESDEDLTEDELPEDDEVDSLTGETIRESMSDLLRSSDQDSDEESQDDGKRIVLSQEEKEIFSYFMPIDGMESSICKALYSTKEYLQGKRDVGGHIIIQGIQGSGKTMLATSIVKVLQSQIDLPEGPVGKVDGDNLNGKDIGKLFDKIQGGCLIIEKAGELNRETALRLSLMIDNDNSGILVILEDTKPGVERLNKVCTELSKHFTERIIIPPFRIDELVDFAKKYADDCECVIDEMGILGLYDRINIIQSLDHPTAISEVKEIMDAAMEDADKGGKSLFSRFSNKKYDENGYMILREKNFQAN